MDKNASYASKRLTYRGISSEDAELIVAWRSDPENYKFFFNAQPITIDQHLSWFKNYLQDSTRYDFMIFDSTGLPIGTAGLSSIHDESCEISYLIGDVSARGKGYAREAVEKLTEIAFEELQVKTVEARILPYNEASMHVVISAGYRESERVFQICR